MKILIDTNIYLDFYRSNNDALKLLGELVKNVDKIILTDQIINEFERSRETVIKSVKKNFESESALDNFSSSYLQEQTVFKELVALQKQYLQKRKQVSDAIQVTLDSPGTDPIASFFTEFVNQSMNSNSVYNTTEEIIKKAHKRKLIGNPPTSNKYSIGDEINWEIILENIKEDIIIVGRDSTYVDNFGFLQKDFHKHTGRFISKLTNSITKAFKDLGIATSEELIKAEEDMIKSIEHFSDFWKQPSQQS